MKIENIVIFIKQMCDFCKNDEVFGNYECLKLNNPALKSILFI
jgi:hypothetical protein